uniref:Uncharacterized protein n=1 Tax=Solanum tuberosum TaxID=4113 RepID=M1DA99_SOLTU
MTLKTAIPGGNIASKLFDELSHSDFNFGEYKNSTDSSISTKVNSLMIDATDMDEKFAMMEQTIEALKKSIDDKNLQITQLMSKLDLYNSRESHHILIAQEKLVHEFKCVTNEQRRRVKQDILADFKGAFVKIRKGDRHDIQRGGGPFKKHSTIGESYNTNCIALRRSDQLSSSRRSTCNDEVLFDVPGDQIHLKEVYIILHSRNMLLKALESRRSLGSRKLFNKHSAIGGSYTINYIALRRSHQRSSSRRST